MKKLFLILLLLTISWPVLAQSLDATYTFDATGTQISYSSDLKAELSDQLLIISNNSQRIVVGDYPFVNLLFLDAKNPDMSYVIKTIGKEVAGDDINPDEIYNFDVGGRNVAAYDFKGLQVPGSIFAIEFSNGGIGMLVTFNVKQEIEDAMLASFDSVKPIVNDVVVDPAKVPDKPTIHLFKSNGRVITPANWSVETHLNVNLEYLVVWPPKDDLRVILFDFSQLIPNGTDLKDVRDVSKVDWENDYGVSFADSQPQSYDIGEREAISYDIQVHSIQGTVNGKFIVMRFSSNDIVAAIIYGAMDSYTLEISQILGSFNDLDSTIGFQM